MLIGLIASELVLLCLGLVMLLRPAAANRSERRVLRALHLTRRSADEPASRRRNLATAIAGIVLATLVVADWSGLRLCILSEQVPVRTTGSLPRAATRQVDDIVLPAVRSGEQIGVVVGIVDNGRTWTRGYGRTSTSSNEPPDGATIFEIGSITKTFTCTSLALMCRSGEVALDEPVRTCLPQSVLVPAFRGREITLQDLATHTSGLPRIADNMGVLSDFSDDPYAGYGSKQLYDFLSEHKLPRSPGSGYEYSNLGMGLLGFALCRKAGSSYGRMVTTLVCRPLGMSDTGVTLSSSQNRRLAQGYALQQRAGRVLIAVPNESWTFQDCTAGAGAIRSTANDMLKYLSANIDPSSTPLGPALEATHRIRYDCHDGTSTGLGWVVMDVPWLGDDLVIWHNGGTGGYRSFACFCRKSRLGVVVLANSSSDVDILGLRILKSMVTHQARP